MFNKYDVYTDVLSKYCYSDSSVLRNKLNIRDNNTLKQVEADITAIKQNHLLENPINGRFSTNHLCGIHKYLFEDIYRFAGHFRLEIIKKGTTTFLNEKDIAPKLHKLLTELKAENYLQNIDKNHFDERVSYYLAELNYIHPFREGNGRAIREFIRMLALYNGYEVHWNAVKIDDLMSAMIESVFDTEMLTKVLHKCIKKQ